MENHNPAIEVAKPAVALIVILTFLFWMNKKHPIFQTPEESARVRANVEIYEEIKSLEQSNKLLRLKSENARLLGNCN